MRTKVLLLAAAALSAGAFAASAQVYSQNVVGYINLSLPAGYSVIANQLATGNNGINTVLTNGVPDGTTLTEWDFANQRWSLDPQTYYAGDQWYDSSLSSSSVSLNPTNGRAFLINLPAAATITLVGDVPQGSLVSQVRGPGYDVVASVVPVVSGLGTNGFPQVDGMTYTYMASGAWVGAPNLPYTYYAGDQWYDPSLSPVDPAPAVGAGFLANNPGPTANWTRNFTVQ